MPSPFQSAITGGLDIHLAATGEPVTYGRTGEDSIAIPLATPTKPGRSTLAFETALTLQYPVYDYLIPAAALAALDPPEPIREDTITDAAGNVHLVLDLDGLPPFEPMDAYGHRLRIHTRRI